MHSAVLIVPESTSYEALDEAIGVNNSFTKRNIMMVSSCTTCTTTRLILVNSSSRSRQVRGGLAASRSQRFPEVTTIATSYQGGVVTHGGSLRTRCISTTTAATSDFTPSVSLTAVAKSTIVPYTNTSQSSKDTSTGWTSSELVLSTLFALGVSVSFLVGTASAPIEATRSSPRSFNMKEPKGGGPHFNSNQSFMGPIVTAKDKDVAVEDEERSKDVFAMGNRIPYDVSLFGRFRAYLVSSTLTLNRSDYLLLFRFKVSVSAQQGERESMEDEYFVAKGGRFAAVFDGHGGSGVSRTLRKRLFPLFNQYLREIHDEESDGDDHKQPSIMSYVGALNKAFSQVDREIERNEKLAYQGSTAVAVAIHEGTNGYRTLVSGNVGDSRAILSRRGKAVDLTRDHKPNEEGEKARILGMGGTIQWDPYGKVHRVLNLSTSRAIGDRYARPMVSGQVEIKQYPFMEDIDEFFLVASDGLWDVMTSQEVVDFVHDHLNDAVAAETQGVVPCSKEERSKRALMRRRNMARYVANESISRGSMDNVSVLIVWLREI